MGPKFLRTMQIYSIKVAETEGFYFEWPLEDPFLHLTGPSRAIMSGDDVMIDVHLKLKGTVESKDRTLISKALCYDYGYYGDSVSTRLHKGLCMLELCSGTMPVNEEGYLELSRRAVSVKINGRLAVLVHAREASGSVVFTPQSSSGNIHISPGSVTNGTNVSIGPGSCGQGPAGPRGGIGPGSSGPFGPGWWDKPGPMGLAPGPPPLVPVGGLNRDQRLIL
uniref:DUF6598 domain-containing protein n=1 Tax=Aegilops tauschii TaxID=37682 RepID=M8BWU3_AEGTA